MDSLGRVLVAGSGSNGSSSDFAVTRYTAGGTLDTSFGGSGIVTIAFGTTSSAAYGVAVDSANRVLVAGGVGDSFDSVFAVARLTAHGVLDTTFDADGKQTFGFGSAYAYAKGVAVDSADRVLVAGLAAVGGYYDFAVARLTSSGALDPSFDSDGRRTIDFGGPHDYGHAVAVDSTDRIVVAGYTQVNPGFYVSAARLTVSGALDTSFFGGTRTFSFGTSDSTACGVALDSADRIVVAGHSYVGTTYDFAVARLTVGGGLDATFDGDGKQTIAFGTYFEEAYSVAVDSADRVVVAGYTSDYFSRELAVARLTAVGAIDTSFDADGKVIIGAGMFNGYGVAMDSADRVVVACNVLDGTGSDFGVCRLTATGAFDTSFDADGKQRTDLLLHSRALGRSVAVDSTGRTVVAGYVVSGAVSEIAVARYTVAGILDASFGGTGVVTFGFASSASIATGVAVDSADRVVVAGITRTGSYNDFAVARLTTGGTLDMSFDGDGKLTVAFGPWEDYATAVAVDSADRVVVSGYTQTASGLVFAAARLTPAGTLDVTFDGDGKQTVAFGAWNDQAYGVAVDSADRILLAGITDNGSIISFAVARLTTAGAIDLSFDADGKQTISFNANSSIARAVTVDSADRVVVAGYANIGADAFAVARLTDSGAPDPAFDADGKLTITIGPADDQAYAVAVDSTDRVLLAGINGFGYYSKLAVVRLTPGGALDPAYDGDGVTTIASGFAFAAAYGVAVDKTGCAVVAGNLSKDISPAYDEVLVARLTGDAPARVSAAQVNDGSAQRSRVTSLRVIFDTAVTFPPSVAGAFLLRRQLDNSLVTLAAVQVANAVTLTFAGGPTEFGSLADGRYTLTVFAAKINGGDFDGNGDGVPGDDYVLVGTPGNGLFRLFGDTDGDADVDALDLGAFRAGFGTANFDLDFDGDGDVDALDFGQFRRRFGSTVP